MLQILKGYEKPCRTARVKMTSITFMFNKLSQNTYEKFTTDASFKK